MRIVEVASVVSSVSDHGLLDEKLGHRLWARHHNAAHSTPATTELYPLEIKRHFSCGICYHLISLPLSHDTSRHHQAPQASQTLCRSGL